MLTYNLQSIFDTRKIAKPHAFLIKAGISRKSASTIINKSYRGIKLDHLEIICKALVCEPSDLFLYTPDKNENLPENHPLRKLKIDESTKQLMESITSMPLSELKILSKEISEKKIKE